MHHQMAEKDAKTEESGRRNRTRARIQKIDNESGPSPGPTAKERRQAVPGAPSSLRQIEQIAPGNKATDNLDSNSAAPKILFHHTTGNFNSTERDDANFHVHTSLWVGSQEGNIAVARSTTIPQDATAQKR